ncbi:MAG: peptidase S1 [Deinococcota bacterium]
MSAHHVTVKKHVINHYLRSLSYFIILLTSLPVAHSQGEGGNATLSPGFWPDPIVLSYYSGGNNDASNYGDPCVGRIASVPDHILTVTEPLDYLHIYVESNADTTLIVEQVSTGEFACNDDANDLNPGLEWDFVPVDIYHIYVGNYHENDALTEYQLFITEFEP